MPFGSSQMILGDPRPTRQERVFEWIRTGVVNVLFFALVLGVGYVLTIIYETKQQETWLKKLEVEAARADLQRDIAINDALKRTIAFLKSDAGVEKVARDRLGLVRPNEASFVVVNAPTAVSSSSRAESKEAQKHPQPGVLTQAWGVVLDVWNGGD